MTLRLSKEIKREVIVDKEPYTVTISPSGVTVVPKGRRKGRTATWKDLASGDFELESQLVRSLTAHGKSGVRSRSPRVTSDKQGR